MRKTNLWIAVLASIIVSAFAGNAYAACSDPSGAAGEMEYDTDTNKYKFCDGDDWINVEGTAASAQSAVAQGTGTAIGNLTSSGGLAAAFDGTTNQAAASSATIDPADPGYIGKDWGSGNTKTISGVKVWGANNSGYMDAVAGNPNGDQVTIKLLGSNTNNPSTANDLGTIITFANTAATNAQEKLSGFDTSTAYRYHWVSLDRNGPASYRAIAEVEFYESATSSCSGTIESTMEYSSDDSAMRYCDGSSWLVLNGEAASSQSLISGATGTVIGDMTQFGGNAAAFDGVAPQAAASSARKGGGTTFFYVGKDWGSGNSKTISAYKITASSNEGFWSDGLQNHTFQLQGSNTGAWSGEQVTLHNTGALAESLGQVVDVSSGINTSNAYRYHRIYATRSNSTGGSLIAEVEFYESTSLSCTGTVTSAMEYSSDDGVMRYCDGSNWLVLNGEAASSQSIISGATGTVFGDMTQYGGNAAAFDGVAPQIATSSARKGGGTTFFYVGKDWGSGNSKTITAYKITASSDEGFWSDGLQNHTFQLQGSNTGAWSGEQVTLHNTGALAESLGQVVDVTSGIDTSNAYRYHRIYATRSNSTGGSLIAEVEFYE